MGDELVDAGVDYVNLLRREWRHMDDVIGYCGDSDFRVFGEHSRLIDL